MIRLLLPAFLLKRINNYLGTFSPLYALHINDLDLHIWRMGYSFEGIKGTLKDNNFEFILIKEVELSLAWRAILKGHVTADIDIHEAQIKITNATIKALSGAGKEKLKEGAKNVKDATVPFNLERLRCRDSTFEFSDVANLPHEQNLYLNEMTVDAHNLTPKKEDELSQITASGKLQKTTHINIIGEMRLKKDPLDWSVNVDFKDFDLRKINPIALRMGSLTFKKGDLSVYVATKSEDGKLKGYVKPFLKDLEIIGDKPDFVSIKHFFIEILSAIGNMFLENSDTKMLATKVSFETKNGEVEVDTEKAIKFAIKNGFGKSLTQGYDEKLKLK